MAFLRLPERFDISRFAYAHRGLWTEGGPTENSLDAFQAAAHLGLGIEFDVRPSQDGVPLIFHDPLLDRLTQKSGSFENHDSNSLLGRPLKGGGEIISLTQLLEIWPTDLPLLCELKIDGTTDPTDFARAVSNLLLRFEGLVAAMSFSPVAVGALHTSLMRGQLIPPSKCEDLNPFTLPELDGIDYLACHTSDAPRAVIQSLRVTKPVVAWTVRDPETCESLSSLTESQIFEGIDVALAKRLILNR